ncbi:MAG: ATP-binding protein [Solirubrobacterales bacterium]
MIDNEIIKFHYDIASGDYLKGGEASSNIKKALMQLGIDNSIIKRVCVASYEAEMNIVIHSLGGSMEAKVYEDRIEIVAADIGPGIKDIKLALTEGYSTATEGAREMGFGAGMGLPNIKNTCDELEINSAHGDNTVITMKIYFNKVVS